MDRKKLIRDFPPSRIEDKTNWQGPLPADAAANQQRWRDVMDTIGRYNADKKLREDAIDSRMQKAAPNAGGYYASKKERSNRMEKAQKAEDLRVTKEWQDAVNHNTDIPRGPDPEVTQKADSALRGHGKAIKKRLNDWKVK